MNSSFKNNKITLLEKKWNNITTVPLFSKSKFYRPTKTILTRESNFKLNCTF